MKSLLAIVIILVFSICFIGVVSFSEPVSFSSPERSVRVSFSDVNVDVHTSIAGSLVFISCSLPAKMTLVSTSNSVLLCTPEDEVILIDDDKLKAILVLGETVGSYTKINLDDIKAGNI